MSKLYALLQAVTLVNCSDDDINWRLDTDSEHARDTITRGIFTFAQSDGTPLCAGHGGICGCVECGETKTICVQFCPSEYSQCLTLPKVSKIPGNLIVADGNFSLKERSKTNACNLIKRKNAECLQRSRHTGHHFTIDDALPFCYARELFSSQFVNAKASDILISCISSSNKTRS